MTLFKQILREWPSNLWLALELLIVSVAVWFVTCWIIEVRTVYTEPLGFDIDHTYLLSFNNVTDKNPSFIPDRTRDEMNDDMLTILERLQHHPVVEAAALSFNSYPYNPSNSGVSLWNDRMRRGESYAMRRMATPDFVKVFRYEGVDSETLDELVEVLRRGELLVTDGFFVDSADVTVPASRVKGQEVHTNFTDSARTIKIGAVIRPVRYHDYDTKYSQSSVAWLDKSLLSWANEYCIRVHPEADHDIHDLFMDQAESLFHVGNKLLVNVTSFSDLRTAFLRDYTEEVRNMLFGLGFLLVNIFLGLFGTFWFRTRQRVSEVAIRLSFGATPGSIFRRLVGEGVIILTLVTPIAVGLDFLVAHLQLNDAIDPAHTGVILLAALLAWLLIALMIIAGIWFPASRAAKTNPAVALKDE